MKLSAVENRFRSKGRIFGSVFLLRPADAVDLVKASQQMQIAVFGAEGFFIMGNRIQPSMAHSMCVPDSEADPYGWTIDFLRSQVGSEAWFEVMVDAIRQ